MAGISEFIVSVVELIDAQADDIRCSFLKSANSVVLNIIVGVICIIGLVFFLLGLHTLLEKTIGEIWAYFACSAVAFLSSFIIYKVFRAKWYNKRKAKNSSIDARE